MTAPHGSNDRIITIEESRIATAHNIAPLQYCKRSRYIHHCPTSLLLPAYFAKYGIIGASGMPFSSLPPLSKPSPLISSAFRACDLSMPCSARRYAAWRFLVRSFWPTSQQLTCDCTWLRCKGRAGQLMWPGVVLGIGLRRTYLLPVMQTLVVVLQWQDALLLPAVVRGGGVGDVAGQDFLPEGEAARRAWWECQRSVVDCLAAKGGRHIPPVRL